MLSYKVDREIRNIGIIKLDTSLLLKFLDFPNGKVIDVKLNSFDACGTLDILIEDDDMPETPNGNMVLTVEPSYTTYTDCLGHTVTIRVKDNPTNI